jgi:hypothetical protein
MKLETLRTHAAENFLERTYDPSCLDAFTCPRKGYYIYMLDLESKKSELCFAFGTCFHTGLELFYSGAEEEECIASFDSYVDSPRDELRTKEKGRELVRAYIQNYKNADPWDKILYIEKAYLLPMGEGRFLSGKIDLIVEWMNLTYVVDHKTSSWPLTDFFFRQFNPNIQMTSYSFAAKEIIGECAGVYINAVDVKKKTNRFRRQHCPRTQHQYEDFVRNFHFWTNIIELCIEHNFFPMNESKCKDYGGCPYAPLCIHGATEDVIEAYFNVESVEI